MYRIAELLGSINIYQYILGSMFGPVIIQMERKSLNIPNPKSKYQSSTDPPLYHSLESVSKNNAHKPSNVIESSRNSMESNRAMISPSNGNILKNSLPLPTGIQQSSAITIPPTRALSDHFQKKKPNYPKSNVPFSIIQQEPQGSQTIKTSTHNKLTDSHNSIIPTTSSLTPPSIQPDIPKKSHRLVLDYWCIQKKCWPYETEMEVERRL